MTRLRTFHRRKRRATDLHTQHMRALNRYVKASEELARESIKLATSFREAAEVIGNLAVAQMVAAFARLI